MKSLEIVIEYKNIKYHDSKRTIVQHFANSRNSKNIKERNGVLDLGLPPKDSPCLPLQPVSSKGNLQVGLPPEDSPWMKQAVVVSFEVFCTITIYI